MTDPGVHQAVDIYIEALTEARNAITTLSQEVRAELRSLTVAQGNLGQVLARMGATIEAHEQRWGNLSTVNDRLTTLEVRLANITEQRVHDQQRNVGYATVIAAIMAALSFIAAHWK